jgi:hypothetical protein
MAHTKEHERISKDNFAKWRQWGSYVSARCWGTVRESGDAKEAWGRSPFEQARSKAARWSEDGIGGFSDDQQRLCLTSAFWNGQDPFLKERFFGLSNDQGNHGEDVKDYFFFIDGLPSYSYMKMLYRYPQVEFPYQRLVQENALRGQDQASFQLIDALPNTFANRRYFDIQIEFAKASPNDLLYRITATNCGDRSAPLHMLPQLFYRNTWERKIDRPQLCGVSNSTVLVEHPDFAGYRWYLNDGADLLFTDNETNFERLFDGVNESPYTKDGIDYAVVRDLSDRVNAAKIGTKCAAHYHAVLAPQQVWTVRTRLSPDENTTPFADFDTIFMARQQEADEFYQELQRDVTSDEERALQRAAFAGLAWNSNFYHFNVKRWTQELAPAEDGKSEDTPFSEWQHFDAHDILSIPDPWEYPWLASWDLSFQVVTLAMLDVELAKRQSLLLLSDRYMHPNGAMASFEGDPETPHPPVHAWAVLHVYRESQKDQKFLQAAYEPLKRHFRWWLKTHQPEDHLFDGGFLGKDNISVVDRNNDVPEGGWIAQVDSTGWMAFFALNMLVMAVELAQDKDADYFLTHFLSIRKSLKRLWNKKDQFFYDVLTLPKGKRIPLKVRSLAGFIPLVAAMVIESQTLEKLPVVHTHLKNLASQLPDLKPNADGYLLLSVLTHSQIKHLLNGLFDPKEFFSSYGLRSLSKIHAKHPARLELGDKTFELDYVAGNSKDKMFGGNSNWRGPIWAPLNHVLIEALYTYDDYFKTNLIQHKGKGISPEKAARQLIQHILSIFKYDQHGHRPYLGENPIFQRDTHWQQMFWFYEHFHAETGEGLGASHQNGWTAFVAGLIKNQGRGVLSLKANQES